MDIGEVAKRSNATDCKSVAPAASEVRILPSPPAFARRSASRGGGLRLASQLIETKSGELRLASQRIEVGSMSESVEYAQAGLPAGARGSEVSERVGGSNSVVESQPSKLLVAGSIPVSRSSLRSHDTRASYGWRAMESRRLSAEAPRSGAKVDEGRRKVVWGS